MKEKTVIRLAELASGVSIVVVHAVTGANGALLLLGALLLGVPVEVFLQRREK